MPRKLTIALGVGVMLVGAALRVLLGTISAIAALLVGAMLIVFVSVARNEEAEDKRFFDNLRGHASSLSPAPPEPTPTPVPTPQPSTLVNAANWPDVLLQCNWRDVWDAASQTPGHWVIRNRVWELSAPSGGPVYNVQVQSIDLGGLVARFALVEVLTTETSFITPVIYDVKTGLQVQTHDLETVLSHPPHNADTRPYARPEGGDQLTAEVPVSVHYSDKTGTQYRVAYVFRYDFYGQSGRLVRVNGIERLSPVSVQSRQLQESDPQIYVEIDERRTGIPPKTVFILSNHGGGIARNVQLDPLMLQIGAAVFPPVDHIAEKHHDEVIPTIETFGVLQKHDIGYLLVKEWDTAGVATDEFVRPMRVVYEDYTGRKFETTFNLVFHAVRYTIRDNHSQSWSERKVFEVRDTKVTPIVPHLARLDESATFGATAARRQRWETLASKFGNLDNKPVPVWGQWIYTFETKRYDWSVRHSSETAVKHCIELCKQGGRLLLAEPSFRQEFPDIAAMTGDDDRWLLAIYKVARIGKVSASNMQSSVHGGVTTSEGGEIKDLPGASQVLCQMALNGF